METRTHGSYEVAGREIVAEGADVRVTVLTLAAGQCVPWHYHNEVADTFVCLAGPMVVETRAPRALHLLMPGERCAVPPKTAHTVRGKDDGPCQFLIVQGVGIYDFIPVGGYSDARRTNCPRCDQMARRPARSRDPHRRRDLFLPNVARDAHSEFAERHIPGAVFFDIEESKIAARKLALTLVGF